MPLPPLVGALTVAVALHVPDDSTRALGRPVSAPVSAPISAPVAVPMPAPIAAPAPVVTRSHTSFAADSLVVEKVAHRLTLYYHGAPVRTYLVALGNPVGDKERRGDRRTPVGLYHIDYRNARPKYVEAFWNLVNWGFVASNMR